MIKNYFKILSVTLALLMALSSVSEFAHDIVEDVEEIAIHEIEWYDDVLCFFRQTDTYTVNASAYDGIINFNLVYANDDSTIYQALLDQESFSPLTEASVWEAVCDSAMQVMEPLHFELAVETQSSEFNVQPCASVTFKELLLEELEALYGEANTVTTIGAGEIDASLYATIKEYYDPYTECVMRKTSIAGMTVQAFATVLGIKSSILGALLMLSATAICPTSTAVCVYYCTAFYERVGIVEGTPYYRAYHTIIHKAICDPTNIENSVVVMDTEPYQDMYDPSSNIFNSLSQMIAQTKIVYEAN